MGTPHNVAGIGEVLWDAFPDGEKFGGAPANFTCHCHSLGAKTFVISAIGDDKRGADASAFLDARGIDTTYLSICDHETGVVLVTLDAAGKPAYEIKEGVAWDNIPWLDSMGALAPRLDAVCFGSLSQRNEMSRSTIQRFLAATRPDCLRVFDINIRQHFYTDAIIAASLETASVLKLNDEELPLISAQFGITGNHEEQLREVVSRFDLKLAVLTIGPKGALMMTPTETSMAIPEDVPVVSTVGAGDSFTAATIMGFLNGRPLAEINETANALATFVCTQQGAAPALPASLRI